MFPLVTFASGVYVTIEAPLTTAEPSVGGFTIAMLVKKPVIEAVRSICVGPEDDTTMGSFIPNENAPAPDENILGSDLRAQTERLLLTLTPRERKILDLRFGLSDDTARTLQEIAEIFSLTRERVRQIEMGALRKLRHPSRGRKLRSFLIVA